MAEQNGTTDIHEQAGIGAAPSVDKGKGKAVDVAAQNPPLEEEEDSSEEEDNNAPDVDPEEDDDEDMEEIETDNIIADGRRTRGKVIDFAKAANEAGDELEDDEDDDEDFEEEDEEMHD